VIFMPQTCRLPLVLTFLGAVVLIVGCEPVPPQASQAGEGAAVGLEVVKLADLNKAIAANRGKVVLVDIWGEF
jgi:hypothetical protein